MVIIRTQNNTDRFSVGASTSSVALSVAQNGQFSGIGNMANSFAITEGQRSAIAGQNMLIDFFAMHLSSDAWTAASTNTMTQRIDGATPATPLVITLVSGGGTGLKFVTGQVLCLRGLRYGVLWESDSVAVVGYRGVAIGGVYR